MEFDELMQVPAFGGERQLLDLPPALAPCSTRAQRRFAHKAKMEGKSYDRSRRAMQRAPITTRVQARRLVGLGSIAQLNRHTGKPHEDAREIMRRTMSPIERRAFAAKVAAQLGMAA